jgi:hypothetical protein
MHLFAENGLSYRRWRRSSHQDATLKTLANGHADENSLVSTPKQIILSMDDGSQDRGKIPLAPSILAPIMGLPIELLQEIHSQLPLQSKVCLSLTSKAILSVVGNESWKDPCITRPGCFWAHSNFDTFQREEFLSCLSRDLEDWDFCVECKALHKALKGPMEFRPKKELKPCLAAEGLLDYHPMSEEIGYLLAFEHIRKALEQSGRTIIDGQCAVPLLDGSYAINYPKKQSLRLATYTLTFSARRIDSNLVLRTVHSFTPRSNLNIMKPEDILDIPVRLCPHHTTSESFQKERRWWDNGEQKLRQRYNGPLLTHAIKSVFPAQPLPKLPCLWFHKQRKQRKQRKLREPTMTEENQMTYNISPGHIWWCRSCPTKFRVEQGQDDGIVTVTAWQSFGTHEKMAKQVWRALVKRPLVQYDHATRPNWEFDAISRTFPAFRCE